MNVQHLRGWYESLPAESPHRGSFKPPDAEGVRLWMALAAVVVGVAMTVSGGVLAGLLVVVCGLVWGAVMQQQQRAHAAAVSEYDRKKICLAGFHVFRA
ncbi:hypothetical protein [Streptomyces sp. NPDC048002]|uniref:hypothetical protein n=1 Tax=unclassified Streptomyces TaxID=2593676 RepID=UPI0033D089AC